MTIILKTLKKKQALKRSTQRSSMQTSTESQAEGCANTEVFAGQTTRTGPANTEVVQFLRAETGKKNNPNYYVGERYRQYKPHKTDFTK